MKDTLFLIWIFHYIYIKYDSFAYYDFIDLKKNLCIMRLYILVLCDMRFLMLLNLMCCTSIHMCVQVYKCLCVYTASDRHLLIRSR